jgi:glycosyltransferase involved in cell wall biosynthesis
MAKSTFAKFFYKLFNKVSDCKIPENAGDFRLMDRRVVDVLKVLPERNRFMKGLLTWPGFRSTHIFFERPARCAGTTKWKPHKLVGLAINGLTSFSIVPLRVASLLGAVISLGAFFFGIVVIIKRLLVGDAVQGYASLMSVIVFLGGVQLLALGVMGEYIGRIYIESKQRPLYVITESTTEPDRKHN